MSFSRSFTSTHVVLSWGKYFRAKRRIPRVLFLFAGRWMKHVMCKLHVGVFRVEEQLPAPLTCRQPDAHIVQRLTALSRMHADITIVPNGRSSSFLPPEIETQMTVLLTIIIVTLQRVPEVLSFRAQPLCMNTCRPSGALSPP